MECIVQHEDGERVSDVTRAHAVRGSVETLSHILVVVAMHVRRHQILTKGAASLTLVDTRMQSEVRGERAANDVHVVVAAALHAAFRTRGHSAAAAAAAPPPSTTPPANE